MTIDELQQTLTNKINQPALAALSGSISLHCVPAQTAAQDAKTSGALHLQLRDGELSWLSPGTKTDATFYFDNCEHALALLTGNLDVMAEFMAGRFRSNGYLLWTFPLLGMFRG